MKSLLMALGYTSYQAGCVAPMIWIFIIGAIAMGTQSLKAGSKSADVPPLKRRCYKSI